MQQGSSNVGRIRSAVQWKEHAAWLFDVSKPLDKHHADVSQKSKKGIANVSVFAAAASQVIRRREARQVHLHRPHSNAPHPQSSSALLHPKDPASHLSLQTMKTRRPVAIPIAPAISALSGASVAASSSGSASTLSSPLHPTFLPLRTGRASLPRFDTSRASIPLRMPVAR